MLSGTHFLFYLKKAEQTFFAYLFENLCEPSQTNLNYASLCCFSLSHIDCILRPFSCDIVWQECLSIPSFCVPFITSSESLCKEQ